MPHAYADRTTAEEALTELLAGPVLTAGAPPPRALTLLDASVGTNEDGIVYRPHLTAALTLANARNTARLHGAEGTNFDPPISTIRALLTEQVSWDAGVTVPDEWTVATIRDGMHGGRTPPTRLAPLTTTF